MFTGLVQTVGTIAAISKRAADSRLTIRPRAALADFVPGESIAVNGACLTVETFTRDTFTAYASAETLKRTNLGRLRQGGLVNLERALAMGDRLGGHLVSGHVDCEATVESVTPHGESFLYRLAFPAEFGPQVIDKGSVTLDGISLTVNHSGSAGQDGPGFLEVNIIPATRKETTIAQWSVGHRVNMETDLIGKYVERMLSAWRAADGPSTNRNSGGGSPGLEPANDSISEIFLRKHGF